MPVVKLPPLSEELELLKQVGIEAGEVALSYFGKDPKTWMKSGNSPVSEADLAVDNLLKARLLTARPDYGWISEETKDTRPAQMRQRTFIVDPIDGTRGFLEKDKYWCISLAIVEDGRPIAGVLQCPVSGDVYAAYSGGGATCNDETIQRLNYKTQEKPLISAPSSLIEKLPQTFCDQVTFFHYVPSLAYRLALAATGKIDVILVRPHCHDWDIAAADIILNEVGGVLLTHHGQPIVYGHFPYEHGFLIGAQNKTCKNMLDIVQTVDLS